MSLDFLFSGIDSHVLRLFEGIKGTKFFTMAPFFWGWIPRGSVLKSNFSLHKSDELCDTMLTASKLLLSKEILKSKSILISKKSKFQPIFLQALIYVV